MERLHMNYLRDLVHRLRAGDAERCIAHDMGLSRTTVRKCHELAHGEGYLEPGSPMPDDATLVVALGPAAHPPCTPWSLEPHQETVLELFGRGVEMMALFERLRDDYGYPGSYSSVRRYARRLQPRQLRAVVRVHIDFAAAPGVYRSLIQELASCAFIARLENVLLCGATGVGESRPASGLTYETLKPNYHALCRPAHRFLADVHASRATGTHERWLSNALTLDLLVLDDFGQQPLFAPMVQDLYDIICERYEHGSIIITSNRAFEQWGDVFGNQLLANVALDRLTHHAYTMVVRGQSYRQRNRRKAQDGAAPTLPADQHPRPSREATTLGVLGHEVDSVVHKGVYGWHTSGGD